MQVKLFALTSFTLPAPQAAIARSVFLAMASASNALDEPAGGAKTQALSRAAAVRAAAKAAKRFIRVLGVRC